MVESSTGEKDYNYERIMSKWMRDIYFMWRTIIKTHDYNNSWDVIFDELKGNSALQTYATELERDWNSDPEARLKVALLYVFHAYQQKDTEPIRLIEREVVDIMRVLSNFKRTNFNVVWKALVQAFAHMDRVINEQSFGNEWIQAEDGAIDASSLDSEQSRKQRIKALHSLERKARDHNIVFKVHVTGELKQHALFPIIRQVITMARITGISIRFVAHDGDPDLFLAFRGDDTKKYDNVLYFTKRDEDIFTREVIVFRSFFMRLLDRCIMSNGTISVVPKDFVLAQFSFVRKGFMVHPTIIDAVNDEVVRFIKSRIVTVAA